MTELPKTFDPAEIESRWYAHLESTPVPPRSPGRGAVDDRQPAAQCDWLAAYRHALDNTLRMCWSDMPRLKGKDALWVVGTDHAGIATQMVVDGVWPEVQQKRTHHTRNS